MEHVSKLWKNGCGGQLAVGCGTLIAFSFLCIAWTYLGIPIALILAFAFYKSPTFREGAYDNAPWLRRIPGFGAENPKHMAIATLAYILPVSSILLIAVLTGDQQAPSTVTSHAENPTNQAVATQVPAQPTVLPTKPSQKPALSTAIATQVPTQPAVRESIATAKGVLTAYETGEKAANFYVYFFKATRDTGGQINVVPVLAGGVPQVPTDNGGQFSVDLPADQYIMGVTDKPDNPTTSNFSPVFTSDGEVIFLDLENNNTELVEGFVLLERIVGPPEPTPTQGPTNTPHPTDTPHPTQTPITIGSEVRTDEWAVTISEVKRAEWLPWYDTRLEPGGQWVVVYGTLRNLTTRNVRIYADDFALTTTSLKGEIRPDGDATGAAGLVSGVEHTVAGFFGLSIDGGQTIPFVVAFDVPEVAEEVALQVVDAGVSINLGSIKQATILPTPVPTATPTPQPTLPPQDALLAAIRRSLGASNRGVDRIDAFFVTDGVITIRWAIDDNLTEGFIKDGAKIDIADILRTIDESGIDYDIVRVFGTFPLVDQFGNSEEQNVVAARYSRTTIEKINWDFFDHYANIYTIADEVQIHPAFRD